MDTNLAFAKALKDIRKAQQLTQEDFGLISSRTYLSVLERGLKSPTLDKIEALADVMSVHPLTLLTLTYMYANRCSLEKLSTRVCLELQRLDI